MGKGRESGMPVESLWGSFFDPACVLAKLECAGSIGDVIEFGCGYGTFTIAAAQMVKGHLLALDIEPEMVAATAAKASAAHLSNVCVQVRDFVADGCGVPDGQAGYAMLFIDDFKQAIAFFKYNTENFPKSANAYDSLGEAFMAQGDKVQAIKSYKKSLKLNPKNENAKEMIKRLRL